MGERRQVVVVPYDPSWPALFERLRAAIWPALADVALGVEHVGSTSVPGLAAKPVIDMDVVVAAAAQVPPAIERLASLGYRHLGDRGIAGREAFERPAGSPRHNLYLCPLGSPGLQNHLTLRDALRARPALARAYGELKLALAQRFPDDIDAYVDGKTSFIVEVLRGHGVGADDADAIERANRIQR